MTIVTRRPFLSTLIVPCNNVTVSYPARINKNRSKILTKLHKLLILFSIPLARQTSSYNLYKIFKEYGQIQKIYLTSRESTAQYEIVFRTCDRVKSLKAKDEYEINDAIVRLKWLPDIPDHITEQRRGINCAASLQTPPTDTLRQLVNVLNDDCILYILLRQNMDLTDLCEVAETCTRLQALALDAFTLKYHKRSEDYLADMTKWCFQEIERYFQLFGASLETFDSTQFCTMTPVLPIIMAHCTGLKELRCSLNKDTANYELRPLFSRLDKLMLYRCRVTCDWSQLFEPNAPIRSLAIDCCPDVQISSYNLPNLVELKLRSIQMSSVTRAEQFEPFFQANAQLLRLHLEYVTLSKASISTVLRPLVNLEELVYIIYGTDRIRCYDGFRSLHRLKSFRLSTNAADINGILDALIEAQAPLESLHVDLWSAPNDARAPDYIGSVCQFKGLKSLEIGKHFCSFRDSHERDLDDQQLLRLVKELPALEEISIDSGIIGLADIGRLLESCSSSLNLIRLTLSPERLPQTVGRARQWQQAISQAVQRHGVRLDIYVLLDIEVSVGGYAGE